MTIVGWKLTEGPNFIDRAFIENEGDTIAIGVIKANGDGYAFSRISKSDLLNAVSLVLGVELEIADPEGLPR